MITLLLAASAWIAPVMVPPDAGTWAAAPVPAWLEQRAPGALQTVRLLDGDGNEVPFLILDTASRAADRWHQAEVLNLLRTPTGWALDVQLEPGQAVDGLRLEVRGDEGVLEGRLLAGGTEGIEGTIIDGVRLGILGGTTVLATTVPAVDLPRLRLELVSLVPGLEPVGVQVRPVGGPVRPRGWPPLLLEVTREPSESDFSRWGLRPTDVPARIDALRLEVSAPSVFRRSARVEAFTAGDWRLVGTATLERIPLADGQRGLEQLEIPLVPGVYPRLRLVEEPGGERALELAGASGRVRPRWMVFPAESRDLRLETGEGPRSRTLEARRPPVDLALVTLASVGDPVAVAREEGEGGAGFGGVATSLLFVAAAVLLAVLAWRVLSERT